MRRRDFLLRLFLSIVPFRVGKEGIEHGEEDDIYQEYDGQYDINQKLRYVFQIGFEIDRDHCRQDGGDDEVYASGYDIGRVFACEGFLLIAGRVQNRTNHKQEETCAERNGGVQPRNAQLIF